MNSTNGLTRFLDAQNLMYLRALSEIKNGKKTADWMEYVFPHMKGSGFNEKELFYGIQDVEEAMAYIQHPVLGKHLIEISTAVLALDGEILIEVLGTLDGLKLQSCMTLFASLKNADPVFGQVLQKHCNGLPDALTLLLLIKNQLSHETV